MTSKIPKLDLEWLYHQRKKNGEKSTMQMGKDDLRETKKQTKAEKRKANDEEAETRRLKRLKDEEEKLKERDYSVLEGPDQTETGMFFILIMD